MNMLAYYAYGAHPILLVLLVIILIAALPSWPYSNKWGYPPVGLILLILILVLLFGCSSKAGDVVQPSPTPTTVWYKDSNVWDSLFNSKNVAVAVYPSMKFGGDTNDYGFGGAILYPVSQYAFAGGRIDYLGGQLWAPSAVVGAKYTLTNWPLSPTVFTVGGLIFDIQGNSVGAITGIGATARFIKRGQFSLNGFVEGEKWTNFSGTVAHVGLAGGIEF